MFLFSFWLVANRVLLVFSLNSWPCVTITMLLMALCIRHIVRVTTYCLTHNKQQNAIFGSWLLLYFVLVIFKYCIQQNRKNSARLQTISVCKNVLFFLYFMFYRLYLLKCLWIDWKTVQEEGEKRIIFSEINMSKRRN